MKKSKLIRMQNLVMGGITISSLFLLLNVNGVFASSVVDEFTITVPESCSLTSTVGTAHTATIENGVYSDDVGETTINAFCNDSEGFSVYAVGYTDDTFGNNTMKPSTLADTKAIATGLATSGDTSNWAMKLTSLSDNYTLTNDFNAYHLVPDEYTKVATYPSNTTTTAGVNIKSTYAAYISQAQPADTYTGKVKYTIVHPSNAAPSIEGISQLTYMQDFKNLSEPDKRNVISSMEYNTTYNLIDNRDNKVYQIARMKDGHVWMAENLDLGRTELTTDLTSANTNLSTTVTASTFNGWKKSYTSQTTSAGEYISITGTDSASGTPFGTIYNYYVASAGTITGSTNSENAQYDICPAGWRLPTGGELGELKTLNQWYDSLSLMRAPITDGGAAFSLAGNASTARNGGYPASQNQIGYYWSSTRYSNTEMNRLYIDTSGVVPKSSVNRMYDASVRCVLDANAFSPNIPKTITDFTYMQEFQLINETDKESILDSMELNTTYNLIDKRDNKTYAVAKLKDGNIWMADNLDLGRTELTTSLTCVNTNLNDTVTSTTFNGWKKTSGTYNSTAGEFIPLSGTDATSGIKYGTLYNYYAATAGTFSNNNDAVYDICPAGWRLPTGGNSGEFLALYSQYNTNALLRASIANGGASFALAGNFEGSNPKNNDEYGFYWSSTTYSSSYKYYLYFDKSSVNPVYSNMAGSGYSIRCIAK